MLNTIVYPFERNRYYPGKMLTSADFSAEQNYFNSKRRFVNNLMFGGGIVCGLGVVSLDDLSILVESGVAMDASGREILLESSQVKKLSAVDGFDGLLTEKALLCIKYDEEEIHTVFSVNKQDTGKDHEYNRIKEGAKLFLMDENLVMDSHIMDTDFFAIGTLVSTQDFELEVAIPATVSRGRNVKLVARVKKLTSAESTFTFHGVLQVPGFITAGGDRNLPVDMDDVTLENGEEIEFSYWVRTIDSKLLDTTILLKSGTGKAFVDDKAVAVNTDFSIKVLMTELNPRELVVREIGRVSLEMRGAVAGNEFIPLALINLVRTDSAYIIESVVENRIKRYIQAPGNSMLMDDYLDYFYKDVELFTEAKAVARDMGSVGAAADESLPMAATGIIEIPLGENPTKGDIAFSGEITHGLGRGNVYVSVGYEYISDDPALGVNAKSTVYGNPELFRKQMPNQIAAETAVKVLNDKGSFVVAAKLLEKVDFLVLTFRWVAIRFPAGNDLGLVENFEGKSITAETPTVVLGTKESHFFGVRFNNMKSCSIAYELTEPGSGEITSDGIYTSPSREGVYEIRIYCTDMPVICTYAYAIVKKKEYLEAQGSQPGAGSGPSGVNEETK